MNLFASQVNICCGGLLGHRSKQMPIDGCHQLWSEPDRSVMMNGALHETELMFAGITAFALGYGLRSFAKHIGDLARRRGIFTVFLFPIIGVVLLSAAKAIYQWHNVLPSLIFAAGFVIKMVWI